jgi:hypothetical protein
MGDMALLLPGKTTCPLCGEVIGPDDSVVGTTHFIADESDPLWRYSDAAFHRNCFERWEHRAEFETRYEAWRQELNALLKNGPPKAET